MAINLNPNQVFPNITVDATPGSESLTIPLSDFVKELTVAEVDPTEANPDFRELLFSIVEQFSVHLAGLAEVDKPNKTTVSKTGRLNANGDMSYTYSIAIDTTVSAESVVDEPS